uniref:Putative secreted protein n=1 Tax=Anopheles darlingi TaxID=43151 RepID=A0A2M4DI18_ANODA
MAGFVPLKAKIAAAVAAAVAVVGPDDGGRALPTAAGLAAADASGPRCGGAAGELDADEESEDDVSEISVPFSVECDDAAMGEYWR